MGYDSVFKHGLFDGQVVFITGGGSGIGRCTAHELAALGATVAIAGRTEEKLEKVKQEIESEHGNGRASAHVCDIRDEQQVIDTVEAILETHGKIDGLVNNAGGQYRQPISELSTRGFEAVVKLNLTSGFVVSREVYNRWMKDHGGNIVNVIADMWHGWPNCSHSGAARAGMMNFTESAASEWAPAGVRINAVAPGGIASSGFDTYPPEYQREILKFPKHVPMQRYGNVAEISGAIVYLLSPVAAFITGSCIRVDGGAPNSRSCWLELTEHDQSRPFDGFHLDEPPKLLTEGPKSN